MSAQLAVKHSSNEFSNIIPLYPESKKNRQEKMLIENISVIAKKIGYQIEDIESDSTHTIEFGLMGAFIYVDITAHGWDYRNIELTAVDIINDDDEPLEEANRILFNVLSEKISDINNQTANSYYNK